MFAVAVCAILVSLIVKGEIGVMSFKFIIFAIRVYMLNLINKISNVSYM